MLCNSANLRAFFFFFFLRFLGKPNYTGWPFNYIVNLD
jgi:hypothetical protein